MQVEYTHIGWKLKTVLCGAYMRLKGMSAFF